MKNIELIVKGMVQGVFYREGACKRARELDLKGYVKNERDGSVRIIASGDEERLKRFIQWCKKGSETSDVRRVIVTEHKEEEKFADFTIKE